MNPWTERRKSQQHQGALVGVGGVQVRAGERLPEPPGRVLLPQAWLQWPG